MKTDWFLSGILSSVVCKVLKNLTTIKFLKYLKLYVDSNFLFLTKIPYLDDEKNYIDSFNFYLTIFPIATYKLLY